MSDGTDHNASRNEDLSQIEAQEQMAALLVSYVRLRQSERKTKNIREGAEQLSGNGQISGRFSREDLRNGIRVQYQDAISRQHLSQEETGLKGSIQAAYRLAKFVSGERENDSSASASLREKLFRVLSQKEGSLPGEVKRRDDDGRIVSQLSRRKEHFDAMYSGALAVGRAAIRAKQRIESKGEVARGVERLAGNIGALFDEEADESKAQEAARAARSYEASLQIEAKVDHTLRILSQRERYNANGNGPASKRNEETRVDRDVEFALMTKILSKEKGVNVPEDVVEGMGRRKFSESVVQGAVEAERANSNSPFRSWGREKPDERKVSGEDAARPFQEKKVLSRLSELHLLGPAAEKAVEVAASRKQKDLPKGKVERGPAPEKESGSSLSR